MMIMTIINIKCKILSVYNTVQGRLRHTSKTAHIISLA